LHAQPAPGNQHHQSLIYFLRPAKDFGFPKLLGIWIDLGIERIQ